MDNTVPQGFVLVLRTCRADMTSRDGFKWPEIGSVEAPYWNPYPRCGSGLHGWLWGEGEGSLGYIDQEGARWLVLLVKESEIVDLGGKVKFPRCEVIHCGDQK